MENIDHDLPQEPSENNDNQGLWLTNRLLEQLRISSRLGAPLMIISIILGISTALMSLYYLYWFWSQRSTSHDFYLLEDGNLFRVLNLLTTSALIYFFTRGIIEGHKTWQLLRSSETNDDALLEGTERLGKMFRWLTIWGGVYVVSVLGPKIWHTFTGYLARPTQF